MFRFKIWKKIPVAVKVKMKLLQPWSLRYHLPLQWSVNPISRHQPLPYLPARTRSLWRRVTTLSKVREHEAGLKHLIYLIDVKTSVYRIIHLHLITLNYNSLSSFVEDKTCLIIFYANCSDAVYNLQKNFLWLVPLGRTQRNYIKGIKNVCLYLYCCRYVKLNLAQKLDLSCLDQFFKIYTKPVFLARIDANKLILKISKISPNSGQESKFFQKVVIFLFWYLDWEPLLEA